MACFQDMCSLCVKNTTQNAISTSPAAAAAAAPAQILAKFTALQKTDEKETGTENFRAK